MKHIILFFCSFLLLASCTKQVPEKRDIEVSDVEIIGNGADLVQVKPDVYEMTCVLDSLGKYTITMPLRLQLNTNSRTTEDAWMLSKLPNMSICSENVSFSDVARAETDLLLRSDAGSDAVVSFSFETTEKDQAYKMMTEPITLAINNFDVTEYRISDHFKALGKVSSSDVGMSIDFNLDGGITGYYFYTRIHAPLLIQGTYRYVKSKHGFECAIEEFCSKGNTGCYAGVYSPVNGRFFGQFYVKWNGKTVPFDILRILDPEKEFADIDTSDLTYIEDFEAGLYSNGFNYDYGSGYSDEGGENWDAILDSYEQYVNSLISYSSAMKQGDLSAIADYSSALQSAKECQKRMQNATGSMSTKQLNRYQRINNKMITALQ